MAIDCSAVPANVTYGCSNPWGQGCVSELGFDFPSLWTYLQHIQAACATDTRLFGVQSGVATTSNAAFTRASCVAIAGSSWTALPAEDIWTRLTTWKFPLFQLIVSLPRPPLGIDVQIFVVNHLLGDPIDTVDNLLLKLSKCQENAQFWKNLQEQRWKQLTMITDAYIEWDQGHTARDILSGARTTQENIAFQDASDTLAADRTTNFLPIIVAEMLFISTIIIGLVRTAATANAIAPGSEIPIRAEAHTIAFTVQYLWIVPAVFLGSIIGVSQTEATIPRILKRLQTDLGDSPRAKKIAQLNGACFADDKQSRIFRGGVYSWQPWKWQRKYEELPTMSNAYPNTRLERRNHQRPAHRRRIQVHTVAALLIVTSGTLAGAIVSGFVPPDGIGCRHIVLCCILAAWLLSAYLDVHLDKISPIRRKRLFWLTFAKDAIVTSFTIACVGSTQVGILNRCSCSSLFGRTGVMLPQMPEVARVLRYRIGTLYPAVTFSCVAFELVVVPLFVWWRYGDALRVYVQCDDGTSNAAWFWIVISKFQSSRRRLPKVFLKRPLSGGYEHLECIPIHGVGAPNPAGAGVPEPYTQVTIVGGKTVTDNYHNR